MINSERIVIRNLNYSAGQKKILKNISLSIGKGEFIGLVGPNGAGKTTLLKCVNGLNKAEGYIGINGIEINKLSDKKIAGMVSLMNQDTSPAFSLPAIDIVMMGRYPHLSRLRRESKKDYDIARKYMSYTDTLKFENAEINRISGGERQRIMMAKVLTQETDIILLDEPTASLDIVFQEQIFKYSKELSDSGKTIIAAVHDLKIATRYCSRLLLIKEGSIIADGSPEAVIKPENLSRAYGVNALVYKNSITGLLDFHVYNGEDGRKKEKVHIIGGGGTASGVIRQLFENGYKVSAGIFAHGDSDLKCAEVFGIPRIECSPFSDISDEIFSENVKYIKGANITILCNMLFGHQNIRNLEAAKYSERLVIIEDDTPESRDFTGGRATEIYNGLKKKAIITTTARLHEVL